MTRRELLTSLVLGIYIVLAVLASQQIDAAPKRRAVDPVLTFHHGYYAPPLKGETDPTVTLSIARVIERVNDAGFDLTADRLEHEAFMLFRNQGSFGRAVYTNAVARDGFLFVPVHCNAEPAAIWLRTSEPLVSTIPTGEEFVKVYDMTPQGSCT